MKKRNTVFQHLDLYVRISAQMGVRLKKRNTVFQHLDLYVRISAQMGVKMHFSDKLQIIRKSMGITQESIEFYLKKTMKPVFYRVPWFLFIKEK